MDPKVSASQPSALSAKPRLLDSLTAFPSFSLEPCQLEFANWNLLIGMEVSLRLIDKDGARLNDTFRLSLLNESIT